MRAPEVAYLRQVLAYNPETGALTWLPRSVDMFPEGRDGAERNAAKWNARFAGKRAGSLQAKGYIVIMLEGRPWLAHRLIWALVTGAWPSPGEQVDHINHDRADNRWRNLRLVDAQGNARNKGPTNSAHIGVSWHLGTGKWQARIGVDGGSVHLGLFDRLSDAQAARARAERQYEFHPNHGRNI